MVILLTSLKSEELPDSGKQITRVLFPPTSATYSREALNALQRAGGDALFASAKLHPPYPDPAGGKRSLFWLSRTTTEKLSMKSPRNSTAAFPPHPLKRGR